MPQDDATVQTWRDALAEEPTGTDLSDIGGYGEEEPPWRFDSQARTLAQVSHRLLVLGDGGEALLESLGEDRPEEAVASAADPASLPFEDDSFDLVIARHAPFDAAEVFRVLAPEGTFATQQVGPDDLHEIHEALGIDVPSDAPSLQVIERELTNAGFSIERSDAFRGRAVVTDVVSLLRFLRRMPWTTAEDLDVDAHREALERIAERLEQGPLELGISRFWVLARTPEAPRPAVTDFSQLLDDRPDVPEV